MNPFLLAPRIQIEQIDSVRDQLRFYSLVKTRVCLEAWRLVDLNQPRFAVFVNKNVKAENLKAQLVLKVVWLARLVKVGQTGLSYNHCLDQNVINILSQFFVRLAHALQSVNKAFKATLVRPIIVQVIVRVSSCVLDEVVIVFVDGVVGEMHEKIVDVGISWLDIRLSC